MNLITTNLDMRLALLKKIPLFSHIHEFELKKLAAYFHDIVYSANTIIVQENEEVDSIFIIVEGNAEVSYQDKQNGAAQKEVVAELFPGEAIGLSDTGLFSERGLRSATVTAMSEVFAIRLELIDLNLFLQAHPQLIIDMHHITNKLLRINFIKKLEPFTNIPQSILDEVASHMEEVDLEKDEILFRQGDEADCCYLLYSGKVNILLARADGSEDSLAELPPGSIIGELALLTDRKRNATAQALSTCKLLILKVEEFKKLVQQPGTSDVLTSMLMDRDRPQQCDGVSIHTRLDAQKNAIVIMKNAKLGVYFKTSEEGLFVWNMLDGEHTIQDIAVAFFYEFHKVATDDIGVLIVNLMRSGFVKAPKVVSYVELPKVSLPMRVLTALTAILQCEYSIKNVDVLITKLYQRGGFLFFTKIAKILMALIAVFGFYSFITYVSHAEFMLRTMPHAWIFLFLIMPVSMLTVPFHELAHALTTKAYGFQVHRLGIGWFWFGPIAFADTSDMWLSSRGPRIAVNLAGIYINIVIGGCLALLTWVIPNPIVAIFVWFFALSSYLTGFYNLDPMFELDGYYVLMDSVDKSNLRTYALKWLILHSKETLFNWKLARQYFPEILYWVASIMFIFVSSFIVYLVQVHVVNNILPPKIGGFNPSHYQWVLSILVLIISFSSLYFDVKKKANLIHK